MLVLSLQCLHNQLQSAQATRLSLLLLAAQGPFLMLLRGPGGQSYGLTDLQSHVRGPYNKSNLHSKYYRYQWAVTGKGRERCRERGEVRSVLRAGMIPAAATLPEKGSSAMIF